MSNMNNEENLKQLVAGVIPKHWYKNMALMSDADLYNFLLKPFKKTKSGLKILIRQRLQEKNETLKDFKKLTEIAFTKAPLKKLISFFETYGGLYIPDIPSPPKSSYISSSKDIRGKFQINRIDLDDIRDKNPNDDLTLYEKLENTKIYNEEEQADFWQKLKKGSTTISKGVSFKKKKIENVTLSEHQVKFMNHFLYNDVPGAVMFHGVGTGKTLTAVGLSNMYLMIYPHNKVLIASPPALLDNFVSSLIQFGLDIRDNRYTFTTYLKLLKMNTKDMPNTLLLIDEAHNFRTHIIETITKNEEGETERKATQNKRGYELMTKFAVDCHKICLMTGTAFVNELYDIENLLTMVNHRPVAHQKNDFNKIIADDAVRRDYFKYKVSHYTNPPNSKFFPDFIDQLVPVIRTKEEEEDYNEQYSVLLENYEGNGDPFHIFDRRLSNTFLNKNGVNPKIQTILDIITTQDKEAMKKNKDPSEILFDKSIIYTGFLKTGVSQLAQQFNKLGIKFVVISGDVNTSEKINARRTYNLYGRTGDIVSDNETLPRILIITKAGTEGVDTQWTKNIFLLDGCWNEAANEQIIARAIRFQSHYDPQNPNLRSVVLVYRMLYINPENKKGADEGKIDELQLVKQLNTALAKRTIYDLGGFDFKATMKKLIDDKNLLKDGYKAQDGNIRSKAGLSNFAEKLKTVLTNNQHAQSEINDALEKIKFQSDTDMQNIKNSVWDTYKTKYKVTSVKHLSKEIQSTIHKEITGLKSEYWSTRGKNFGNSSNVNNIMSVLNSGKISNELFLYLLSNAKQQVIVEFLFELDKHIKQLEDLEINKESVKIIDKIIDENYKLKRPMTDEEKNKIVSDIRQSGMSQTANNLLNENYTKSEVSRTDKILHDISLKYNKMQEKKIEKSLQEYFTPVDIAVRMINYSNLHTYSGKKINILEPTAGEGGLVGPILKFCADNSINIGSFDCCEFSKPNREELKKSFAHHSYLNISDTPDFFNYTTDTRYDFIFMNPPYNLVQEKFGVRKHVTDLDFVLRAYQLLNKGGHLISLVYGPHIDDTNPVLSNHMNLLRHLKYSAEKFTVDWDSSQNQGDKKIKIKSLPLAIILLHADNNKEYEPITPIDINTVEPSKKNTIDVTNENLGSINDFVDDFINKEIFDSPPPVRKKN